MSPLPYFSSQNQLLKVPITRQELDKCVKSKDTAPGCDETSFSMIKDLPDLAKNILIQPVSKQARDLSSSSAIRPISLMSYLCKIFNSVINKRIEWYLERGGLLSEVTVGFRKARSCLDNFNLLISKIQIGYSKKLVTIGCFVDIDNAYNNVDVTTLLLTLDQLGVGAQYSRYLW